MRHKYSQVIFQALRGPTQPDYEYFKKLEDYKQAKDRIVTLKKVIDNFPKKLNGYKEAIDTIVATCENIFEREHKDYCQFMHNITSSHKALGNKLIILFNQFGVLSQSTNIWIKEINDVSSKCNKREECRQNYEHYEEKLYELNMDRMKEIKKKNKVSESDHERFIRNIGKFQKAGKDLIYTSNQAYRAMETFLNTRYDKIVNAMVSFIEAERNFYNEASHIMNFFTNIRNNTMSLKKSLAINKTNYDASNYIKGRDIIRLSVDDIFNLNYIQSTNYGPVNNNINSNAPPGPNQGMDSFGGNNYKNNKIIINPFSADNNDLDDNNDINNKFGRSKTLPNNNYDFNNNNRSTRNTYALNNPYNTQANPYANNGINNNNNNNPYMGNNNQNPYDGNNNLNPYDGNNNQNPYDGNNNKNNKDEDPFDF